MKRLALFSVLIVALLGFASVALAQEASVFGDGVLVRAYLVQTGSDPATYSAYLEVRDDSGAIIEDVSAFSVTGVLGTSTPQVEQNPFLIHDNDLVTNDISISYDILTKTIYVFCSDGTVAEPHLHVMKYDIHLTASIDGVCGSSDGGTFTTTPLTNLCSAGEASSVTGDGPWNWTCAGENGGETADCSANIQAINGVCGSSNGGTFTTAPTTNLCSVGTASSVTGSGPWNWTCPGSGGGTTATCSANLQSSGTIDLGFPVTAWGSITGVSGSSTANNVPFTQTITIKNTGTAAAGSFTVKTYISTSNVIGSSSELLDTWTVPGLAAGATLVHTTTQVYSGKSVHSYYYMIVKVDANDQYAEQNEAVCKNAPSATQGCNTYAYQFFVYR